MDSSSVRLDGKRCRILLLFPFEWTKEEEKNGFTNPHPSDSAGDLQGTVTTRDRRRHCFAAIIPIPASTSDDNNKSQQENWSNRSSFCLLFARQTHTHTLIIPVLLAPRKFTFMNYALCILIYTYLLLVGIQK
jgi:hypothetical protein